jgi:4-diphosphocytidyl-2-C-methyl-D-erythritol kinase
MPEMIETAPAKINLTLSILGRRSDGFHALESLVGFAADCGDVVRLDDGSGEARDQAGAMLRVDGAFATGIVGDNLLQRTLAAVSAAVPGCRLPDVALTKMLPVAAGLGGGSADAGALLRALRRWVRDQQVATLAALDWAEIAAGLGSDVPVCFAGVPAVVTGRGERVEPVPELARLDLVLANPQVAVPADKTAQVFRALAAGPVGEPAARRVDTNALSDRSALLAVMARCGNDLTAAALRVVPEIGMVLAALRDLPGCRHAQMAGAGPTCFGVFDSAQAAAHAAGVLASAQQGWWVRASRLAAV